MSRFMCGFGRKAVKLGIWRYCGDKVSRGYPMHA
jgi:hypothetical protein